VWEKLYKVQSNGFDTNLSVYLNIKDELYADCKKNNIKAIKYNEFVKITRAYFFIIFTHIIDKYATVKLYRFGELNIRKIIPDVYVPKSYRFIKVNNKLTFVKNIDLSKTDGYVYFLNWYKPISYINYKIKFAKKWRIKLINKIFKYGADYPEYNN